ncbi:cyclopropane-fatty-acyl-phospholipid synthase family protein [Pelomonas sp. P7]|uniref:Cyclopropane-fatty-acyl-phospholipid synthase family protein n=1 Tax=Pelomonas caseinilytica TaxID=2906763 RepID=A0ABS8X684_9BURK|nr:cyclopropane-fatty-acyl-phospholipid synthase family protein [Pelomonas sp. P7]MCE4535884.1 cyclopropane-fatty-acyl-phospholipid synthase family protein [Pelomonas sp. P7]
MSMSILPALTPAARRPSPPAAARRLLRLLERLPVGQLELRLPDGALLQLPTAAPAEPRATLHLRSWAVFERTLQSGDIGFAEAFIDGEWDSPDLAALLRLCLANRDHIESLVYGRWWGRLAYRLRHLLRRNSRVGSARNIHAHYDLGNDFYRLWLDPGMSYSAAWFEGRDPHDVDLACAQLAKTRRALREAGVAPGKRVLEIGCGWGYLAEVAARDFDAKVTGITLSAEQLRWGRQRIEDAGLDGQVELQHLDYRDLPARHAAEPFDAVVSIEMFEAVGREYWAGYFRALAACLKPDGRACIQTITIRDDLFARYVKSTDFIQQYIFPGGLLPSPSAFEAEARRAGFVVENRLAFGRDYAETLRRWRTAFEARLNEAQRQGFDRRFQRIWGFYLAYCEAAFDAGNTDVIQFTLRRPGP